MGKDRDSIIARIKKLLAMTSDRGATEAEAIQAALAAQRLIADYDVADYELGADGQEEPIEKEVIKASQGWAGWLAETVAENFRCKHYRTYRRLGDNKRRTQHVVFLGYSHDAKAAALVFKKLHANCAEQLRRFMRSKDEYIRGYSNHVLFIRDLRANLRYSFVNGYITGVARELEKQAEALMLVCPSAVIAAYDGMNLKDGERIHYMVDSEAREAGERGGRDAVRAGRMGESGAHLLGASQRRHPRRSGGA